MRTILFAILVTGCSDPAKNNPDANIAKDAAIDAKQLDAPPLHLQGQIELSESTITGTAQSSNISSTISSGPPMGVPIATDGKCQTFPLGSVPTYSAGTIAITGTATALTLTPSGAEPSVHYATTPDAPAPLYASGATIHIAGAGGDFAAFSGDVIAPSAVAGFTAPAAVSRAGTTLTWTADATTTIMQIAVVFMAGQQTGLMLCRVPDTGSYAIPASSFALLPAGATTAFVALGRTNETVVTNATGALTLQVVNSVGASNIPVAN